MTGASPWGDGSRKREEAFRNFNSVKKAECQRVDAFELWCWRRLVRVPWTARRSNQSILKKISPEYSLEGLMLKLKLQYFGHLMEQPTYWKSHWCWERLTARGEGGNREWDDWMDHWLNGHEFEQTPGDGGQGSLACCSLCSCKESDMTEPLNNKEHGSNDLYCHFIRKFLFRLYTYVMVWMLLFPTPQIVCWIPLSYGW